MCDTDVSKDLSLILYCRDKNKTQRMFEDPSLIVHCPDKYKTQRMVDEADGDDCLAALKSVPNWFLTSKMIKKLFTAFYADENIL